jgi:hypothetical protein
MLIWLKQGLNILRCVSYVATQLIHYVSNRGSVAGKKYYFLWHNNIFLGLAKDNCTLINKKKADWEYPSQAKQLENIKYI